MNFLKSFKNSDGSFTTYEWSEREMFTINFLILLVYVFVFGIVAAILLLAASTILSSIFIIIGVHDFDSDNIKPNLIGLIISIYYIIDVKYKFIITAFSASFFGDHWFNIFYNINIACLITHSSFIIFANEYYKTLYNEAEPKIKLYMAALIMFVLSFVISSAVRDPLHITYSGWTENEKKN